MPGRVMLQRRKRRHDAGHRAWHRLRSQHPPCDAGSETVRKYTGTPSVSEAAALLAAGADGQPAPMSALLIEKHKLRGPDGRNATVSVAAIG